MGAPILMYFSDMLQPPTTASASGLKSLSQPGPLSDPSGSWSCLQIKTDRSARVSQTDHFTSNKLSAEKGLRKGPCPGISFSFLQVVQNISVYLQKLLQTGGFLKMHSLGFYWDLLTLQQTILGL